MERETYYKIILPVIFIALALGLFKQTYEQNIREGAILKGIELAQQYTPEKKHVVIVDWRLRADKHRLLIVDISTRKVVYSWYTSHGRESGNLSRATKFSNVVGSHKSSLGLMLTQETYYSQKFKAKSLRLKGLDPKINGNVRKRAVVIHPANYVSSSHMSRNVYPGRSRGCITLNPSDSNKVIKMIEGGTLIVNIYY